MLAALQAELDALADDERRACRRARRVGQGLLRRPRPEGDARRSRRLTYYERLFAQCSAVMLAIQRLPVPVIARVQGIATAAGCQLVAMCDLAVASRDARFAVSGVNVGLFCSTPSVALSRNVPRKTAFEMLVTGDFISADEARDEGPGQPRRRRRRRSTTRSRRWSRASSPSRASRSRWARRLFYRQLEQGIVSAYEDAGADHGLQHDGRRARSRACRPSSTSARRAGQRRGVRTRSSLVARIRVDDNYTPHSVRTQESD